MTANNVSVFDLAISILAALVGAGDHIQGGRDGGVVEEGVRGELSTGQEREGCPMTGRERGESRRGGRDSKTPRDR